MSNELGKPDPEGNYVIILDKRIKDKLRVFTSRRDITIEEHADVVIVKTKSRSLAKNIIRKYRNYLVNLS